MTYKIPVPEGKYTVFTFHTEQYFNAPGKRVFNIVINGNIVKSKLDVYAATGGRNQPLVLIFPNIASVGGAITVSFTKDTQNPFVHALRIRGPGADTIAIAGNERGHCRYPVPSPSPPPSPFSSPSPRPFCVTGRKENEFSMNVNGNGLTNGEFGGENTGYIVGSLGRTDWQGDAGIIPAGYRYATGRA